MASGAACQKTADWPLTKDLGSIISTHDTPLSKPNSTNIPHVCIFIMILFSSGNLNSKHAARAFPHFMHAPVHRCIRGSLTHSAARIVSFQISERFNLIALLPLSPFQCLNRIIGMPTTLHSYRVSLEQRSETIPLVRCGAFLLRFCCSFT